MQRLLTFLLRKTSDDSLGEAIAGDLEEQRRQRAARAPVRAAIWYIVAAVSLIAYFWLRRVGVALARPIGAISRLSGADVRHAVRAVGRSRWYAATSIAVMALTMALATTAFAVVDGVLFKSLPYRQPEELHEVRGTYSPELLATFKDGTAGGWFRLSVRDVEDLHAAVPAATFALHSGGPGVSRVMGDLRAWVPATASIDANFFEVLGMRPLAGGFAAEDFETPPGAVRPALITYGLWQSRFGGRTDVIGQPLEAASGATFSYRVAGILPRDFVYPTSRVQPNLLTPLVIPPAARADRNRRSYAVLVRLPSGTALETYQARFTQVSQSVRTELSARDAWDLAAILPLGSELTTRQHASFALVLAAALLIVALGCVNVSGLMASRGLDRAREITLRRALGARGRDLARLVVAEAIVIVAAGSVVGVVLTQPALALVLRLLPEDAGLLKAASIDVRVLVFSALTAIGAVFVVSLWPLRQYLRRPAQATFARTTATITPARSLARGAVISLQIALGLALTLGGALLVGSLIRVWHNDLGHTPSDVVVIEGTPAGASVAERANSLDAVLARVRALPGVEAAGATDATLWRSSGPGGLFAGDSYAITSGFLETLAPRLLEGRWPTADEITAGAAVVVVTPFVVAKQFGGGAAIGQTIVGRKVPFTVIGVAASARYGGFEWMGNFPQFYVPYRAAALRPSATVVVKAGSTSDAVLTWALAEHRAATAPFRVSAAATADDLMDDALRSRRLQAWLFGSFAVVALTLVGVGVLGLIAMAVERRTREIGVRVALGATRVSVVRLLLREQFVAVVAGLGAGVAVSMWAVGFVKSYVYEITVYDARVWAIAVALILVVAALGVLLPARRASGIDPVKALRVE